MNKRQFQMPHKLPIPSMTAPVDEPDIATTKPISSKNDMIKERETKHDDRDSNNEKPTNGKLLVPSAPEARQSNVEKSVSNNNTKGTLKKKSTVKNIVKNKEKEDVTKEKREVVKKIRKDADSSSTKQQRPATMEEFKASCEALVEAQIKQRALQNESRQVNAELQKLRGEVVPFLLSHNRHRVDCSRLAMYISTRMTQRPTTIGVKQLYEIIEEILGKESLAAVQREAANRRQQKRQVRETRIMPLKRKLVNKETRKPKQRMNELLSEFKTKLQGNNVTDDDFANAYNVIVAFMQQQQITTICDNETFFANLYNRYGLLTMLQHGVPMHLMSTHQHALLYCYTLYGSASVFGNIGEPFGAISRQSSAVASNALLQDQDSAAIATTIGVAVECARSDNVFERTFDEMIIAASSLIAEEQLEERREEQQMEQQVKQWQQQEWSQFTESLQEYEQSFDCAAFFYNIFVNAPPGKKPQRKLFDEKYQRLWKKIQRTATKGGAECVSHVAWLLCTEQPSSLALIRNRRADGSDGLFATMARFCERAQMLASLRLAMDRRARQLLRRTTVKYVAENGNNSNHIDLCIVPVQHVFMMGCAVLDWCRLVDASTGHLGEGAARLRCCFADTELPIIGQDASMFLGLDRIPTTGVEWHASCDGAATGTFTLYGRDQLAINVRTFATNVASTVENGVATVQLLFGDRSSFDSILRCLYYGNIVVRSNPPPSLNTLLEPLLLLSASKCASKATELMNARRAVDRFGHIDAFHWPSSSSSSTRFPSSSSSVLSAPNRFSSSSSNSTSTSSSNLTNASNKRRNLFAEEESETINAEDKLDDDETSYDDDKLVDEFSNNTHQHSESIRASWSVNADQVLIVYRYRHRLCDFAIRSASTTVSETCDLYPWKTATEFSSLQQLHDSRILWQHLWTLPYEQLWLPAAASPFEPPTKVEFEQRRLRFLEKHVKAMWSLNGGNSKYIVHLHSEWDEFDLLPSTIGSNGFIQFESSVAPTFFNVANAARLMNNYWLSALYPWRTGKELIALLLHQQHQQSNRQQQPNLPKQPVRRWQQLWSLEYQNLWPQSYQSESHQSTFEQKRDRFVCRHVQAMWQLTSSAWFVAHLRGGADEATDPYERLSPSGFVCFPMSLDDSVFSNTGMTILMRNVSAEKYPWSKDEAGDKVLRMISAASPNQTVAMLKRQVDAEDAEENNSAKEDSTESSSSNSNQPPEKRRKNASS